MIVMSRTLMVLQAGYSQVPVIKAAKEMALKVVAIDRNPNAHGMKVAHEAIPVDVIDVEGVIKVAEYFNIDGVLPCGDVSVPTAAAVAEHLDLPGLNPEIAEAATDKAVLYQRFAEGRVPHPNARIVSTVEEAFEEAENLTFPLILKPTTSFGGSRGVIRINKADDLAKGFAFTQKASRKSLVIMEEFLDGIEHTVESLTYKAVTHVLAMSDKVRVKDPYCVATSLDYPSGFSKEVQKEMREAAKKAVKAVGIENGAAHIEVITTDEGSYVIDFGARGGGAGFIPAVIVPHVSGVNMIREMIRMVLGDKPENLEPTCLRGAVYRFFKPNLGKVLRIKGVEEARRIEEVVDFRLDLKVGDIVPPLTNQLQRVGQFVVLADNREMALKKADEIEKLIKIEVE